MRKYLIKLEYEEHGPDDLYEARQKFGTDQTAVAASDLLNARTLLKVVDVQQLPKEASNDGEH